MTGDAGNFAAIKRWIASHRPDCSEMYEKLINTPGDMGNAMILISTMCFEAGRMFQAEHPSNPESYDAHSAPLDYLP